MLEEELTIKDTTYDQICTDLGNGTSVLYIQKCLPEEYKQQKKRRVPEQSTGELANKFAKRR
jgi:hypothetical protein